jgi:NAD(P) transhydrogenase subunit alpha
VTILGPTNLPSEVARHASQMYSKNISTFLLHIVDEGQLKLDTEDEIVAGTLIARDGKVVQPLVCELLGSIPGGGKGVPGSVPGSVPRRGEGEDN